MARVQGPFKDPRNSRVSDAHLCYLSFIFKHSNTNGDTHTHTQTNIVNQNLGGGGWGTCCAPSRSTTDILTSLMSHFTSNMKNAYLFVCFFFKFSRFFKQIVNASTIVELQKQDMLSFLLYEFYKKYNKHVTISQHCNGRDVYER